MIMKNFVVKDIEPSKAESARAFLKEMNDFVLLISHVKGPHIAEQYLTDSEGTLSLEREENGYEATFSGHHENEKMQTANFQLSENGTKLFEARYTVGAIPPYDMFVMLNCSNGHLVKAELELAFKRDFSHESEQLMKTDLPTGQSTSQPVKKAVEQKEVEKEVPADKSSVPDQEADTVTEEIEALSEKVMQSIDEVQEIIGRLNALCHDLTRGGSGNFSTATLSEEILENGATVLLFDKENDGYKVTFRKGMLDEQAEIAFFLEHETKLVFSIYISSSGVGRISASKQFTIKQVRKQFFE